MKSILIFIIFYSVICANAQQLFPGGVSGAFIWEITQKTEKGQALWNSNLPVNSGKVLNLSGKFKSINSNPALIINAKEMDNTIDLGKLETFSIFIICQESDSLSENIIVSLENDSAVETVFTNQRMAALDVYRYANYGNNNNSGPKIYSYFQNKSKDSLLISRRLKIGRVPRNQNIPVSDFNGIIPEFILYDRFLSFSERQKIESYLALKYGISLNQNIPTSYFNSKGDIIWDANLHSSFNQNITGVGRDDVSGLYQKLSENSKSPGEMKIGTVNEISDNSFLIWGDNGKSLRFENKDGIRRLLREWEAVSYNFIDDTVKAEVNVLSLNEIDPLQPNETYWLMIDRSGSGDYPYEKTDFIQCQPMISTRGTIVFSRLLIDTDQSGSDIFTILAAPGLFTRSQVIAPSCASLQSGIIQTNIVGGSAPFTINFYGKSDPKYSQIARELTTHHVFENVDQGFYVLKVTDANNNSYTEEIWVSNSHSWETKLSESYKIAEGEMLTLDASEGMPKLNYNYIWNYPDGLVVNNKTANITQPGNYILSVTDENNCNSSIVIKVERSAKSKFRHVELFPNPSSGLFIVRADLENEAEIEVTIATIDGKVIKKTQLNNSNYYWYSDYIQKPGLYFIKLTSGSEYETLKLIIR